MSAFPKLQPISHALGHDSPVNAYTEWEPLEEIIVGTAVGSNIPPVDLTIQNFFTPTAEQSKGAFSGPVPQNLIDETEEDIGGLIRVLESYGVIVRRPLPLHHTAPISTPYWSTNGISALMPRDGLITIGDEIIETPMVCRSRIFEHWAYRSILVDYIRSGARISAAPLPQLLDETFGFVNGVGKELGEEEPLFEAANIFRCGTDIFYNRSNTGNRLGLQWLRSHLGPVFTIHEIHVCDDHVGTTLIPLRPGLLLVNPDRVTRGNFPPQFKKWKAIWAPQPVPDTYALDFPRASNWIGINMLILDENHVIVEERQTALIRMLEAEGEVVIPLRYRHGRTFGGSFHCITLDVRRRGELASYL